MSLFDKLFGGLFDLDNEESTQAEHPCSNCPASCTIAPAACSVCQPYKEQMIEAIYRVEHKDEIVSQYEVVGTSASSGTVVCPHCGGHSENPYVCDYCGSKLQEGSGKIQVESAADIPNPVLEAQDIIFSRYDAVKTYAGADSGYGYEEALSGISSKGLFSSIFSALTGFNDSADSKSIGNKMTESEITEMAKYYEVSVSEYLQGLDNGKYLTLSNKSAAVKAEEKYSTSSYSQSSGLGAGTIAGAAGAAGLMSMLFGGSTYNTGAANKPYDHNRPQGTHSQYMSQNNRPPMPQNAKPQQPQHADPRLDSAGMTPDMKTAQLRKEAQEKERKKQEQARREAQEKERQKQEQARREAAKNSSRLDAGDLHGTGRRQAPASADPRMESVHHKAASEPGSNKAPTGAAGMGKRPDRPI